MDHFKINELLIYILKREYKVDTIKDLLLTSLTNNEWEQVFNFASNQGVLALTYDVLDKLKISDNNPGIEIPGLLWIKWTLSVENIQNRYLRQREAIKELALYFKKNGVDMILMKGHDLSRYYDNPTHRECGDIDIFLPGNFDFGNKLIENLGIEVKMEGLKHSNFTFKGIPVENHKTFLNITASRTDTLIELKLRDILNEFPCESINIDGVKIKVPPAGFTALFITRHNIYHFFNSGAVLKYLLDFSFFFNNKISEINLNELFAILKETNMSDIFQAFMLKTAELVSLPSELTHFCNENSSKVNTLAKGIEKDIVTDYYKLFNKSKIKTMSFLRRKVTGTFRFIKSKWRYDSINRMYFYKTLIIKIAAAFSIRLGIFEKFSVIFRYRKLLFLTLFSSILELAGVMIFVPLLLLFSKSSSFTSGSTYTAIIDKFHLNSHSQAVIVLSTLVLVLIILKNIVIHYINHYKTEKLLNEYKNISGKLFLKYFNKGLNYTKMQGASHLAHNINFVCNSYVFGYLGASISLFGEILLVLLLFIFISFVSVELALSELLLFIPLLGFYYRISRNSLKKAGQADHSARRFVFKTTIETFRGYTEILINNAFKRQFLSFESGIDTVSDNKLKVEKIRSYTGKILEIVVTLVIVFLIVIYNFNGFAGIRTDFEVFVGLFIISSFKLLTSVRAAMGYDSSLKNSFFSADILNSESIIDNSDSVVQPSLYKEKVEFKTSIECENLSFGYINNKTLFNNFELNISKGDKIGIKGLSGSGKSTLLNLIMGLIQPVSGEVLVDGTDINHSDKSSWFDQIGYVSQETFVLNDSIRENILIASSNENCKNEDSDIYEAIEYSQLKDFVQSLPEGLETRLGEGGANLSGGERQRISIARAIFKRPQILIFDEPTSNLDNVTEDKIIRSLNKMFAANRDLTLILVSHNEKLFSLCNRIIDFSNYPGVE